MTRYNRINIKTRLSIDVIEKLIISLNPADYVVSWAGRDWIHPILSIDSLGQNSIIVYAQWELLGDNGPGWESEVNILHLVTCTLDCTGILQLYKINIYGNTGEYLLVFVSWVTLVGHKTTDVTENDHKDHPWKLTSI